MMVRFFSLWHFAAVKSCCFLWIIAAQKRDLQLQNQTRESWKFPYSVWWKSRHLWWSNPLSSFQYPSSIKSLILALLNSVLSQKKKKILRIKPTNLGETLLAAEFSTFTLDIQMGISWAFDIEIKQFKSPNSSTCLGLQLWWRIQSEIKSLQIT